MELKERIAQMVESIRQAELRCIERATAMTAFHEGWKRELEEKLSKLQAYSTIRQVSDFLYADQPLGGFTAQKFIGEFDQLILAEMRQETAGWEFVSYDDDYGPAAESVRKHARVKDPAGVVHEFRYGNNGANGMGSEFRSFGAPPSGMAMKVISTEMLRRKLAGESFPLFAGVCTARA